MSAFVIGSTGLVGSQILKAAVKSTEFDSVFTVRRRVVEDDDKVKSIVEKDATKWPDIIKENSNGVKVFFSGFGTTRADAGGIENFKKIDYGTNYACAKAAKEAGINTFVLVSSLGANLSSIFPYMKIKGQLEDDIIALKFPRTIIIRPGALVGKREKPKGFFNDLTASLGSAVKGTAFKFLLYPISGEEVGKVAVHLASESNASDSEVVKIVSGNELDEIVKTI